VRVVAEAAGAVDVLCAGPVAPHLQTESSRQRPQPPAQLPAHILRHAACILADASARIISDALVGGLRTSRAEHLGTCRFRSRAAAGSPAANGSGVGGGGLGHRTRTR
jgi:hypothetical protein